MTNIRKNPIIRRKLDEYDTYIIIYFKEDVTYPSGFYNDYRGNINFIINTKDNTKLNLEDPLTINKDYGIEIHFNEKVTTINDFFSSNYDENMQYLISVDFSNFDSSSLLYMCRVFSSCYSLESIDFSNFDTSSVLDMSAMFLECTSLKSLDLSNFDTSSVTDMNCLFYGCSSLESIDLSSFKTSLVTDMCNMFCECSSL